MMQCLEVCPEGVSLGEAHTPIRKNPMSYPSYANWDQRNGHYATIESWSFRVDLSQ